MKESYGDTLIKWDEYEEIVKNINNTALVLGNDENSFLRWLYKAFQAGGMDVYFQNDKWEIEDQCNGLKNAGHKNVYFLTDSEEDKMDICNKQNEHYTYFILDKFIHDGTFKYPNGGYLRERELCLYKLDS